MRYVTLRIGGTGEPIHAIDRAALPPAAGRGPIHRIELLTDGSVVVLRSVAGDLAAYERALADSDAVYAHSTAADDHVFVHFEPTDAARELLRWRRRFPALVQPPVEFEGDDPIVTLVGDVAAFTDATASLPSAIRYEVRETGQFVPHRSTPFRGLTDRQREVLRTAVGLGYYENPRGATQADVADALSLSPGTVGDHLRKIEAHVFSE